VTALKEELRQLYRSRRNEITGMPRLDASLAVMRHAARLFKQMNITLQTHPVIAGYFPHNGETDILPLLTVLRHQGFTTALPAVTFPNMPLTFHLYEKQTKLIRGSFGIFRPESSSPTLIPNIILCPALAIDFKGNRLGQGGGFYDRTFAALPNALRIGIVYPGQFTDQPLPTDHNDVPMNAAIHSEKFHIF
jgi:5-formyltetrahydrofolate cyclo-ligase